MADQIASGETVDLDADGAKYNHGRFFEVCDSIKAWQEQATRRTDFDDPDACTLYDDLVGDTVVYNKAPCGRIRLWTRDQSPWNESCNFEIQGAGATGTKIACILLSQAIRRNGWDARIVNIIHDEIVVEVEEQHAEACALALKAAMEQAFAAFMPDVPVVAEFPEDAPNGVADCWLK
jgi:DNA polymerase-1